jgi:hypothetical protein
MHSIQQQPHGGARVESCCPIVDLRQYTLFPGTRDAFIALFDREFVETQEAAGMRIIGQFRDLGDPNRFVWLRGFPDMPSRERALTAFYMHGEAWKAHSETARGMMIDSTDALLLRPLRPGTSFSLDVLDHRHPSEAAVPQGLIIATIYSLPEPVDSGFFTFFERIVAPMFVGAGASLRGSFFTEHSPNNFPRLPLREGENIFVSFAGFENLDVYHHYMTALGRNTHWRGEVQPSLVRQIRGRPQVLRLSPTSRSQLRA